MSLVSGPAGPSRLVTSSPRPFGLRAEFDGGKGHATSKWCKDVNFAGKKYTLLNNDEPVWYKEERVSMSKMELLGQAFRLCGS